MESLMNLEIGYSIDWKFGLVTRDVLRISKNKFEINDTCGRWVSAIVTKKKMQDILDGKISLWELDWQ
jgi:hypothetical protein